MGMDNLDFKPSKEPGKLSLAFVEIICDCGFYCSAKTNEEAGKLFEVHKLICQVGREKG